MSKGPKRLAIKDLPSCQCGHPAAGHVDVDREITSGYRFTVPDRCYQRAAGGQWCECPRYRGPEVAA